MLIQNRDQIVTYKQQEQSLQLESRIAGGAVHVT